MLSSIRRTPDPKCDCEVCVEDDAAMVAGKIAVTGEVGYDFFFEGVRHQRQKQTEEVVCLAHDPSSQKDDICNRTQVTPQRIYLHYVFFCEFKRYIRIKLRLLRFKPILRNLHHVLSLIIFGQIILVRRVVCLLTYQKSYVPQTVGVKQPAEQDIATHP